MTIFILKKNNLRYRVVDPMSDLFNINSVSSNCHHKKNVIIPYIHHQYIFVTAIFQRRIQRPHQEGQPAPLPVAKGPATQ